jgi:predicted RNA-binding protein with TRAM domain|tara:strand:+ start:2688 stop:3080 length:393 start_codon:yes stop_codon:yes gene_type:complete
MDERYDRNVPINEGEEHNVKIDAVGEKGDGIARIQGFVVFIPGVKEGDEVKIKVTKVLRKVGFGEVIGKATEPEQKQESVAKEEKEDESLFDESKDSEDFGEDLEEEKTDSTEKTSDEETEEEKTNWTAE